MFHTSADPATRWRRLLTVPVLGTVVLLSGCGGGTEPVAAPASSAASSAAASDTAAATTEAAETPAESSSAPAAPSVTAPACAATVSDAPNGYSVRLPCGFTRITSKTQLDEIMKRGLSQVKGSVNISASQLAQAKLLAVNPKNGSSVNLVITPATGLTAEALPSQEAAIKQQLQTIGATGLVFGPVTVAGEQALRAQATMVTKSAKLLMVQVYAVHADKVYIWTFTGSKAMPAEEKLVLGTLAYL